MTGKKLWFFKILLAVSILGFFGILSVGGVIYFTLPPDGFDADYPFVVRDSESLNSIATRLEKAGVIRSALVMRGMSFLRGTEKSFKRGEYLLKAASNTFDIHDQIVSGRQLLQKVTLKEGWTATRMARALQEANIVDAEEFLEALKDPKLLQRFRIPAETLDGLLYPDTYMFAKNTPVELVIKVLLDKFFQTVRDIDSTATIDNLNLWYEKVIMASIIEREYRVPDEAPIIGSVFYNRLRYRIPLGSCATIEYIITEVQGKPHPRRILFQHTEIPSPYNTYLNQGLPPTPISNPGRIALKAAFQPAQTDYFFFVVKDPRLGTHTFSRDMSGHIAARELYLNTYVPKL